MDYKGYYIRQIRYGFIFWRGGENDYDADFTGDSWRDNAIGAISIKDAKEQIDDIIFESTTWTVKPKADSKEEVFTWLSEAITRAVSINAVEFNHFNAI